MKANQMPPVENQSCDPQMQENPAGRGLSWNDNRRCSARFSDVGGLRSLLTLNYLEFNFIALSERFETGSTDRAEVYKDVRATLA